MGDELINVKSDDHSSAPVAHAEPDFASFINSSACLIGTTIAGRYRLDSLAGLGGWSAVYKGTDLTLGRVVAVKLLHAHLTVKPASAQRFRQEAEAASKLMHPNLTAIYDFGLAGAHQPYIVMEYVDGTPLDVLLERGGPMSPSRVVRLGAQIADALQDVHAEGLIHRDIKPGNIVITKDRDGFESAKMLDFGLVKVTAESAERTATGETVGTPVYMSPEQCSGQKLDPRSDIYSLGCVLYEMVSGKQPFDAPSALECMRKHLMETAPPLAQTYPELRISQQLSDIIAKAMMTDADQRFASMIDFREALLTVPHDARQSHLALQKISARLKATEGLVAASSRSVKTTALSTPPAFTLGLLGLVVGSLFCGAVWLKTQKFDPAMRHQAQTQAGHSVTDGWLKSSWPKLTDEPVLDFSGSDITDEGLVYLGKLPKTTKLKLNRTAVKNLEPLKGSKGLQELELADTKVDDDSIKPLLSLHLSTLSLLHDNITDKTVESIAKTWPDSDQLLVDYTHISESCLPSLDKFKHLTMASLNGTNIGDKVVDHLPAAIEWLALGDTNVSDKGVAKLARFQGLRGLWLYRLKITSQGIHSLQAHKNLESLDVSGNPLSEADFAGLAKLTNLNSLVLDRTHVADDLYPILKNCNKLSWLGLRSTSITDQGIKRLSKLRQLRGMNLATCKQITNDSMNSIADFANLDFLSVSYTNITKDGLMRLKKSKTLRGLKVCGMRLTSADLADLKAVLPNCRIITEDSGLADSDDLYVRRPFPWKRTAN